MSGKINKRFFKDLSESKWYLSPSLIEGEGIFAARDIACGEIIDIIVQHGIKITFFGSKINHSWTPCAELLLNSNRGEYDVIAIKNIQKNQEITLDYNNTPFFIQKPDPNWK